MFLLSLKKEAHTKLKLKADKKPHHISFLNTPYFLQKILPVSLLIQLEYSQNLHI